MNLRQTIAYLIYGLIGALIGFVVGISFDALLFQVGLVNAYGNHEVMGAMLTRAGISFSAIGFISGIAIAWAKRQLKT